MTKGIINGKFFTHIGSIVLCNLVVHIQPKWIPVSLVYLHDLEEDQWKRYWNNFLDTNKKLYLLMQTKFDAPAGNDPVAIDFTGMGKGEAWVNGQSIGRYWPVYVASNSGCSDSCNYRGSYSSSKCLKNCGKPSQTL